MSQNSESVSIPRGLIARRGAQNASTQRLPSLRSEALSSQALLSSNVTSNTMPITTKGGALKRTFKPTIPVRRNASEDNASHNQMSDNSSVNRRGKPMRTNPRNSRGKQIDNKKFVQMEAAVFSGANNPELKSSRFSDLSINRRHSSHSSERIKSEPKTESNRSDEKSEIRHESKIKLESKAGIIRKLYGDNFVDDDYEDDEDLILPKGWDSVSGHRVAKQTNDEPLNPYNLLKTEDQEKLLLIQIPEYFLNRRDGYVGKMRVYKSGKIELIDTESGIKFDILLDNNLNLAKNVKLENKSSKEMNSNESIDISQDLVSVSNNDISVLGTLKHEQILLAVPQIPIDDPIGPTIPL